MPASVIAARRPGARAGRARRAAIIRAAPSACRRRGHVAAGEGHDEAEADTTSAAATAITEIAKTCPSTDAEVAREADEGQVRSVEHDLEREEHDQRAPAEDDAGRADPEEDGRDGEIPGRCRGRASGDVVLRRGLHPSTTPPTAATSSTIEVISKASRWSVRKSRPISAGLPNEREISAASDRPPPAFDQQATTTSTSSAAPATKAPSWSQRGPPAQGASARPPR